MPPVTQTLLIANVAVFLLQSAGGGLLEAWFALWPPGYGFWIWQLVTYGFLHAGIGHIFFNMLGLYMFGSDIERLFGSRYFLFYYFACLVTAALTQLVFTAIAGGPPVPTLFPPIPMQARVFVILFGALELVFGVTGTAAGVAHFAHLGGMLGGWLAIQYRRRGFPFTRQR